MRNSRHNRAPQAGPPRIVGYNVGVNRRVGNLAKLFLTLGGLLPSLLAAEPVASPPVVHHAIGTGGAVASPHPLATRAGLDVLRKGGTAIDAIAAVGLTLGVVDSHNSGIGGGCFLLVRLPDGVFLALDGREMAPAAAARDMYLRDDGTADTAASRTGARAAGIPGSLAVYDHALRKHGSSTLASHLNNAALIAELGFRINSKFSSRLEAEQNGLARFAGLGSAFFQKGGKVLAGGDVLRQPDLAETYRSIAREGIGWFYGGAFADATAAWMRDHGGIITRNDFENYKIREREAIRTAYRGYAIVGFPPPSSGGTHVAQILNILEPFDLAGSSETERTHLIIEAMKLAFADRAHWLGDSDYVKVPTAGLVSAAYARKLAARIDSEKATSVPGHGEPGQPAEKHTAHFTAVDQDGCWAACTATLNTSFGSKVLIPGTGVLLNNQMDDFSIKPGVPNAFGLVGAEANAIAPGKRPLSSMSPTIVLKDGRPILTVGAAGGPTIITQSLLTIINTLDLRLSLHEAVKAPRFHHQWRPDFVAVEKGLDPILLSALEARGHTLKSRASFGTCQAIAFQQGTGSFSAVSEPRAEGAAGCVKPEGTD